MIIGMAGKAGSGKDTSADYLIEKYGYERLAFADNLKDMCMYAFGLTNDQCYDQDQKEEKFDTPMVLGVKQMAKIIEFIQFKNKFRLTHREAYDLNMIVLEKVTFSTPREILQYVGTQVLRDNVRDDYHLELVRRIIKERKLKKVVITDARFENEREAIKSWNGVVAFVDRKTNKETGISGHASENSLGSLEDYDYVINNTGTIAELHENLQNMVKDLH